MNSLLFFAILLGQFEIYQQLDFIDLQSIRCSCGQMLTRDDCLTYTCKLQQQKSQTQRINITPKILVNKTALASLITQFKCTSLFCSDIKTSDICDNTGDCVWNNNGVCENFQGCGSYEVTNQSDCASLKSTTTSYCTYSTTQNSNGNYTCMTDLSKSGGNFMTCFTLNTENTCNNYSSAVCTWRTFQECEDTSSSSLQQCTKYQYCIGEEAKDCSDLVASETKCLIRTNYCRWNNNTCVEKECSDYVTEDTCQSIVYDDLSKAKPCFWSYSNVCTQGFNLTKLNKFTCLTGSLNTSTWNEQEQKCQSCILSQLLLIYILKLAKERLSSRQQSNRNNKQHTFITQQKETKTTSIIPISDYQLEDLSVNYDEFTPYDDLKELKKMIKRTDKSLNQYGKELHQLGKEVARLQK